MKLRLLVLLIAVSGLSLAQGAGVVVSGALTGLGQNIPVTVTLPLAPSVATTVCVPAVLQKGATATCTVTLDQPVPAGSTGTLPLASVPSVGFTVSPTTVTFAAGASTGTFTVTRQ